MWAVPGADPAFAGQVLSFLDSMTLRTGPTFRDKDVNLGRLHLSSDRRTRHRRLASEKTKFDTILSNVRIETAVRLRQNRQTRLAEAAEMLGFSTGSAFLRWFLAAFGKRPSDWRKEYCTNAAP